MNIFNWSYDSWKSREPEPETEFYPTEEEASEIELDVWELGRAIDRVAGHDDLDLLVLADDLCRHGEAVAEILKRVRTLLRRDIG